MNPQHRGPRPRASANSEHLFEKADGRFSLYWDAVEGNYAEHSFVPVDKRFSYGKDSASQIRSAWEKISGAKRD